MADQNRDRSRSPYKHRKEHRRRDDHEKRTERDGREEKRVVVLPYRQKPLTKHDLGEYQPMFALYLDIQKQIHVEDLTEEEIKGRWKSFVKKWNNKDLAEGWYDPATLEKAKISRQEDKQRAEADVQSESESDDYGPAVPRGHVAKPQKRIDYSSRSGPGIPSLDDLKHRDEDARYNQEVRHGQDQLDRKFERKAERKQQSDRMDELVPKADAGTRERQLEKKQEVSASNRAFVASKEAGDAEIPESDLMGEDSLSRLKQLKKEAERKKSERELKREEILRARAAEREDRSQRLRDKESKTMDMLKELARSRFGDGVQHEANLRE